ncbi:MAG: radical SAM family heme chaperone HemW [Oscillospiraceae bacterium]|jgi:oxygen-independent coproporphyrinogen-3 oxidase|nr:radical SAM family heme chaperone HemW [Oscillospiraceae bacterium]
MNVNTLGLYIHVPFCASKCDYCDFYSLPGQSEDTRDKYVSAMLAHMKETAAFTGKALKNGGAAVDSLYFGGGTPPLLGVKRLRALLLAAKKLWSFSPAAEVTLEANPESLGFKEMKKLRALGVNRLSFGVQATQDELLRLLGRRHTGRQALSAIEDAFRAGFTNVGADLMYGIPGQTREALMSSLNAVIALKARHVSLYCLKIEENTPLARQGLAPPPDDELADLYLAAVEHLRLAGYGQYEISNFSLPSYQSRHNLKYWNLGAYIGFGPSAHSDFSGKRYSNVPDLAAYVTGVLEGGEVVDEIAKISPPERAGEYIMLGLRTTRGISGNHYSREYKVSFDVIEKRLEALEKLGCSERDGERWRLTPKGFLVSNRILSELLDTPVSGGTARF